MASPARKAAGPPAEEEGEEAKGAAAHPSGGGRAAPGVARQGSALAAGGRSARGAGAGGGGKPGADSADGHTTPRSARTTVSRLASQRSLAFRMRQMSQRGSIRALRVSQRSMAVAESTVGHGSVAMSGARSPRISAGASTMAPGTGTAWGQESDSEDEELDALLDESIPEDAFRVEQDGVLQPEDYADEVGDLWAGCMWATPHPHPHRRSSC